MVTPSDLLLLWQWLEMLCLPCLMQLKAQLWTCFGNNCSQEFWNHSYQHNKLQFQLKCPQCNQISLKKQYLLCWCKLHPHPHPHPHLYCQLKCHWKIQLKLRWRSTKQLNRTLHFRGTWNLSHIWAQVLMCNWNLFVSCVPWAQVLMHSINWQIAIETYLSHSCPELKS